MITEYHQVSTLYLLAFIGLLCGLCALIISIANYNTGKRNQLHLKAASKSAEELKAILQQGISGLSIKKNILEKALRELEHDHDRFKDTMDGYAQSLSRIEAIAQQVRDNQHNYLINKNNTGTSKNNIKVSTPNPEQAYLSALLRQLQDKQEPPPEACKTCELK